MTSPIVSINKRGADRLASGHPWIYRSDVVAANGAGPGVVRILDPRKRFLGQALYSNQSQIALRFLTNYEQPIDANFLAARIRMAAAFRRQVAAGAQAYRLVASEGDLLPSLIVDRYGDCLVIQTLSQGMEQLKPLVVGFCRRSFRRAQFWNAMTPLCAIWKACPS